MTEYYDRKIHENEHLKKLVDTYMSSVDGGDLSKTCERDAYKNNDNTYDEIGYAKCYDNKLEFPDYANLKSLVDEYLNHEKDELHKRERLLHLEQQKNSSLTDMGRYRYHYVAWTLASVIVVIIGLRLYK
jgi:hypothetical protein